jgi:uncharacterized protein
MLDRLPGGLRGGKLILGGFLLFLLVLLLLRWSAAIYIEHLWYAAEGAARVFWTRNAWEWGARLLIGVVTAVLAWANLRVVARTFAGIQIRRRYGDLVIQEKLPGSYVRWGLFGASILTGLWFTAAVPQGTGLQALLMVHAPAVGEVDPILGRDLGFYLFRYPVLLGLVSYGMVVTVFSAALVAAGYSATGAISWGGGRVSLGVLPRKHLGILAAAFLVLLGIRFVLAPYGLLLDGNSAVQGIFGYTDQEARIPAFRMTAFLCFATAGAAAWGALQGRLIPAAAGAGALVVLGVGVLQVYPSFVQRFQVQPNELARETPYIEHAVAYTRQGFGLAEMERERMDYRPPAGEDWSRGLERLQRLPIWTEGTLLSTFRQIEARFRYYEFTTVAFDRYPADGRMEPVALAVREVDPTQIPDPSWQNLHLRERFISGNGAVAGQLNRRTEQGRLPMFLTAIPPEFREGPGVPDNLRLTRPQVYVGSRPQFYAVVTEDEEGFRAPDGGPGIPGEDYPAGIPMTSFARTLALAWHFQDANLLFASEVTRESRFLFRRDVESRVRALAPFLHLPEAPYPVVADGRVVWILEGFTRSRSFPLSRSHELGARQEASYLRNSVKITVDAVTGETRLYAAEPGDPILQGWSRAFPGLIRELDELSPDLREHLRYSRWLLEVQTSVLTRFHQDSPPVFHGQQDRWALAQELSVGSNPVPYRPEFGLLTLPGETEESFVLSTVFVPAGRQNLASFLAARWTPDAGPELRLWDVPLEEQVPGPRQVEALVEQDPEISQQFSLWRQGGSQVWTGHLHLVPVGNTLLYMEPIFLAADFDAIPEIRRFVVSDGRRVVMETTMAEAVRALAMGEGAALDEVDLDVLDDPDPFRIPDEETVPPAPIPDPPEPTPPPTSPEALQLLDEAEERLRAGDWEGFGRKLEELRALLRRQAGG